MLVSYDGVNNVGDIGQVAQVDCSENGPDEMTNMSWTLVLQLLSLPSPWSHGGNMLASYDVYNVGEIGQDAKK